MERIRNLFHKDAGYKGYLPKSLESRSRKLPESVIHNALEQAFDSGKTADPHAFQDYLTLRVHVLETMPPEYSGKGMAALQHQFKHEIEKATLARDGNFQDKADYAYAIATIREEKGMDLEAENWRTLAGNCQNIVQEDRAENMI